MISTYTKERINTLQERYPDDKELKALIEHIKYNEEDYEGEDVLAAKHLGEYLNGKVGSMEKFAEYVTTREHRYLQAEMIRLFVRCIDHWAHLKDYQTDGRNEYAVSLCKAMIKGIEDLDNYTLYRPI